MTENTENLTICLLQEISAAQQATDARLNAFIQEQHAFNSRNEATHVKTDVRFDKLGIELAGIKSRIRKVEELLESMARVMSEGTFIPS